MNKPTLLLADDHVIVAEGLRRLLQNDFELVGTVADGEALIEQARALKPQVIVTDLAMPRVNGLDAARRIRRESEAKIVFLSMHADAQLAREAFQAGASAYVLKHCAGDELVSAIRGALEGRRYVTPLLATDVEELLRGSPSRANTQASLTVRQKQVLQLIIQGYTMREIAQQLKLSTRTVESHKYDMMRALQVDTTAELIQYAVKIGLAAAPLTAAAAGTTEQMTQGV